jgi:hypothetical protein
MWTGLIWLSIGTGGELLWIRYWTFGLLVGKLEGKRPLGRPRHRWVDNIRMDLVEVGWGDVDWIGLTQDGGRWRALVNLRVAWNAGKLSSGYITGGLSSSSQFQRLSLLRCQVRIYPKVSGCVLYVTWRQTRSYALVVTAVVLLGDTVERSTQCYPVTEVLNIWEVSMGGSHNFYFHLAYLQYSYKSHMLVDKVSGLLF